MPPQPVKSYRFNVGQFEKLVNVVFAGGDHVELVNGHVLDVKPPSDRHAASVSTIERLLGERLGDSASVAAYQPLRLSADTQSFPTWSCCAPE